LNSDLERQEVENAFLQRKDNIAKLPDKEDPSKPEAPPDKKDLPLSEFYRIV